MKRILLTICLALMCVSADARLWTPADGSEIMSAWWDASDSNTITKTTTISQWDDKSGQNNDATQSIAGMQPVYVTNTAVFGGKPSILFTSDRLEINGNIVVNTPYTIFVVESRNESGDSYFIGGTNGNNLQNLHIGYRDSTNVTFAQWGNDLNVPIDTYTSQVARLWSFGMNGIGGKYLWLNGSIFGWNNQTNLLQSNAGSAIGSRGIGGWYGGNIGEIVIIRGAVSNREIYEGYLAWKWGLQASLPTNHPYYSEAPQALEYKNLAFSSSKTISYNGGFFTAPQLWNPLDFGTNKLLSWYDSSDSNTITITNTSFVSRWNDKSGNGHHAIQSNTNSQPSYVYATNFGRYMMYSPDVKFMTINLNGISNVNYTVMATLCAGSTNVDNHFIGTEGGTGAPNEALHIGWRFSNQWTFAQWSNDLDVNVPPMDANLSVFANTLNDSGHAIYRNGTLIATNTNITKLIVKGTGELFSGPGSRDYTGYLAEVFVLVGTITDDDRSRLEGYMAWKWGIPNILPDGHPYRKYPPRRN